MTPRFLKMTCALAALGLLLGARPALAQSTITLSSLQIDLWPEFDKPSTLVILTGTLAPSVALPAAVTVHIPKAAGGPFAVAAQDASGKLLDTLYTTAPSGDTIAVSLNTDFATFRVEYYDPSLTMAGSTRDYTFRWTADAQVAATTVRVQEPVGARDLKAEPAVAPAGAGDFGLNYYSASLGQLAAGQSVSLRLTYTKSTPALSTQMVSPALVPTPAAAPASSPPAQPRDLMPYVFGAAAVVGLLLVVGSIYLNVRDRRGDRRAARPAAHPARRRRHREAAELTPRLEKASGPDLPPDLPDEERRFCTQCGHGLQASDQFCRNCGAKVR